MEIGEHVRHNCDHYDDHRYDDLSHRKYANDEVDICIIGAGAAGGVLAYELVQAGLSVVAIEAGPFWDPQTDFASDELSMRCLGWQDTRFVEGKNPLTMGHNNSGRGVGGGTVHFTGVFLRFHASDFKTYSSDGVGYDWPIEYEDMAPWYDSIEKEIAVSGPKSFPWGEFRGPYPYPVREPISANSQLFREGCQELEIESSVAPLAILSAPFDGRPPCINRGFCNQGCKPNAKFSTLVQQIPKSIALGAEILSDCMVTKLETRSDGSVREATFVHDGREYRQKAKVVVLANYVVEAPRLLFHSASSAAPDGLGNSSGMVGKCIMTHSSHDIYARFEDEVRLYKGTPVMALTQAFYETEPGRGFARGYTLLAHGRRPVSFASAMAKSGLWGNDLRLVTMDYNYYGNITLVGEVLPNPENRVYLDSFEKDEYGMPRAHVSFSYGANDDRLINHGVEKAKDILSAAGGKEFRVIPDSAHLMGGCRMGSSKDNSVVNPWGQSWDIPNLYITGAPIFVTSSGANPTETVMALAKRTAHYIKDRAARGELGREMAGAVRN